MSSNARDDIFPLYARARICEYETKNTHRSQKLFGCCSKEIRGKKKLHPSGMIASMVAAEMFAANTQTPTLLLVRRLFAAARLPRC